MKFVCLVYGEEAKMATVADRECIANSAIMQERGVYAGGQALQPVRTAKTVRLRNGQISITDGPFTETKEQLAGFYLIDAKDLDEALELAAKIPPVRIGSIEVRPIADLGRR